MNGFDRSSEWNRYFLWTGLALSILLGAMWVNVEPTALFDQEGFRNAADLFMGLLRPDLSPDFLVRIAWLSVESLLIGVLGTFMALIVGVSLAFVAIQVPALPDAPDNRHSLLRQAGAWIRWLARFLLGFLRSIPEIVWAYLFVQLLGLGPGPAVIAIALTNGGTIGKLYAEVAEAVAPDPVHALRAKGTGRLGILLFSVLPQVARQWIAYGLFRMECNIRTGTILGVVGAGGLGSEIALSIQYFEYDKLATALLAVLVFVITLELLSAYLRRSPVSWTLGFACAGAILALAMLSIPWIDLFTFNFTFLYASDAFAISAGFLRQTLGLVVETLAMAWVATMIAAVFAFFLAPLATTPLTATSYLADTYPRGGISGVMHWLLLGASRFVLQIFRAMPELTFALLFVVWVGPGPFAGVLAICAHSIGVLGRLYTDIYEEVEPGPPRALQAAGVTAVGTWLFTVLPQVAPRLAAYTLFRFEVNVRATAMVGFVGAGGIGDALHTAISLFHMADLVLLLVTMLIVVTIVDFIGDRVRRRILVRKSRIEEISKVETRPEETGLETRNADQVDGLVIRCRNGEGQSFEPISIREITRHGLLVESSRPCTQGAVIDLEITVRGERNIHYGRAKVIEVLASESESAEAKRLKLEFLEPLPALSGTSFRASS